MNIGNSDIVTSYLGNSEILRTYLGNRLIQISSNNNIPDFIGTNVFTVVEGGTEACTITATDPSNVGIKFYIIGGEDELQFQLDADTGVLSFVDVTSFGIPTDTDYAGYNTYFVLIRVIDNTDKYRDRMYSIEVTQDNSIPLTILLDTAILTENSDIGTIIGEFSINEDTGYVFSFTNDLGANDNLFFDIIDSSLVSAAILNFDVKDKYYVHVKAEKSGETTLKKPFTITIENVVEAPIDILISKNTIIDENNNIGDVIATLSIVNAESTTTSTVYTVVDELDGDHFLIIGNTIYANIIFNFTTQLIHQLTVSATNSSGTINKTFTFIVRNINDAPIFATETKTFKVYEGNLAIGTILATDIDNQPLTYSINQELDSNKFSINSSSGVLSFNPLSFSTTGNAPNYDFPLDIGGNNIYECTVRASDGLLYATQHIYVEIYSITSKTYYVDPTDGIDQGNTTGTINNPFKNISTACNYCLLGDTIYIKNGTHIITQQQVISNKSGTLANPITITCAPGATVKLTVPSNHMMEAMFYLINISYFVFKDLEVYGVKQHSANTTLCTPFLGYDINYCRFENINSHHNAMGIRIGHDPGKPGRTSIGNYLYNCDFHHNSDPLSPVGTNSSPYGGADGIALRGTGNGTNTIDGCRVYRNSDDGFDCYYNEGDFVIKNSWFFENGYRPGVNVGDADDMTTTGGNGTGLKLGPLPVGVSLPTTVKRTITNCLCVGNRQGGISQNDAACASILYNNTSCFNLTNDVTHASYGFIFGISASNIFKNNISYGNTIDINWWSNSSWVLSNNTFSGNSNADPNPAYSVSNADFANIVYNLGLSTTENGVLDVARKANGDLPDITFMHLASGSELVDAGIDVGLPFIGAPDIGCFEFVPGTGNVAPVFVETTEYNVISGTKFVGNIYASDANGDTVLYLNYGGSDGALFTVNETTGRVEFISIPTYISGGDNTYNLTVRAIDQFGLYDTLDLVITVTSSATLPNGLISVWEFDETTGTTLVDKVGSNDLIATSTGMLNQTITLPSTSTIKGLTFNGTSDYLSCVHRANMDAPIWSVATWINSGAREGYHYIFQKADLSTELNGFSIYLQYNKLWVELTDTSGYYNYPMMDSISELTPNTTYHIAVSYSSNSLKFYLNGILIKTIPSPNPMTISTGGVRVGVDCTLASNYSGLMSKLYWWNKELDQVSIDILYNGGNGTFYPFE